MRGGKKELRALLLGWFRVAPPASTGANILKTLVQSAVVWGLTLGVAPLALSWFETTYLWAPFRFAGQSWIPWLVFVLASLLGLVSAFYMAVMGRGTPLPLAAPQKLVIRGPYRHLRNPMAVAGLLQATAVGMALGSFAVLVYTAIGGCLWNYGVRPVEEEDLEHRFGDCFRRYRREVPCWIPRLSPYASG